ncbi:class I SAM-dependent methyltransferase [Methanobrevibacter sp.]|uniref:class I SAM-dependent methyltransferase n=1 Tax=Methanobrevibacter sp. TaxID=66852 RepID=UPI0038905E22
MGHVHHGKSSATFLDSDEILSGLNLKGNETFMDAGCGDGHIAIKAMEKYLPDGRVYAVDSYDKSIEELEIYKSENNLENLTNIEADITKSIPGVENDSIDVALMVNVFHGFTSENRDDVISEFGRILKTNGRFAIMDFKPIEMQRGPPVNIKYSPEELEEIFVNHNFKKIYLNEEMGEEIPEGRSHYLIIFEKR